jgi:hypothetical protein
MCSNGRPAARVLGAWGGAAQQGADAGDPRIVARGLPPVSVPFRCHVHGAELQHDEALPVQADTLLPEQRGAGAGQPHQKANQQHGHRQHSQRQQGQDNVLDPLGEGAGGGISDEPPRVPGRERQIRFGASLGIGNPREGRSVRWA